MITVAIFIHRMKNKFRYLKRHGQCCSILDDKTVRKCYSFSNLFCFVVTWPWFIWHTEGPLFFFACSSFLKVWLVSIYILTSSLINWYKTKAQVKLKRWYIKELVPKECIFTELTSSPSCVCMYFKVWVSSLLTSTGLPDPLKQNTELGGKCPPLLLRFRYGAI